MSPRRDMREKEAEADAPQKYHSTTDCRMFRFVFRLIATFALAVAVVLVVIDATRSIAADMVVMTPLAESWRALSAQTLASAEDFVRGGAGNGVWRALDAVLAMPGFAVFIVLALLAYAAGYRPRREKGLVSV